jgi:hypothetical protein
MIIINQVDLFSDNKPITSKARLTVSLHLRILREAEHNEISEKSGYKPLFIIIFCDILKRYSLKCANYIKL